ncbi:MAG TPA: glycosyltransferase, partial [Acidimicrobiales bacterium]|nr:glycosyltransferase [Acidimicrobiales bacterium]
MKILHLTSTFPRQAGGPGGSFLEDLARAQAAAGHEVTVVAPHDAGLVSAEQWGSVVVRRFRYAPDKWETLAYRGGLMGTAKGVRGLVLVPLFIWAMFNGLLAAAKGGKVDVIHAHWWLPAGLAGVFAARRLGAPLVITCHGSDVALAVRRPVVGRLARWVLRQATSVATVSESLKTQVKVVAGVDATVLRMPAELQPGTPAEPRPRLAERAERVSGTEVGMRVVAVGRLSREKGFDVLIEALALVPGVEAEIIGDGPELENLRSCAKRLDLDNRLSFSGALPRADYLVRLASADAVIVPSRHEGLGLVAAEALASGKPVICSDVGGLPEVVGTAASGGAARLVRPDDPAALADALRQLPLPSPTPESTAALVERHRPEVVAAAHGAAYLRAAAAPPPEPTPKRRRPLRWLGAAAGLFLLAALVSAVTEDLSDLRKAVEAPHPGWLAAALVLALAAELSFA